MSILRLSAWAFSVSRWDSTFQYTSRQSLCAFAEAAIPRQSVLPGESKHDCEDGFKSTYDSCLPCNMAKFLCNLVTIRKYHMLSDFVEAKCMIETCAVVST